MKKIFDKVLTIDPGWNTGLALWSGSLTPATWVIKEPAKLKVNKIEIDRLEYMYTKFEAALKGINIKLVIIEGVEMWSGSTRSLTSAKRGDLFALAYMVGGYLSICKNLDIKTKLVYPRGDRSKGREMWKGQLNAGMVEKRIRRLNGATYPEHIREAVGIGFSQMGLL